MVMVWQVQLDGSLINKDPLSHPSMVTWKCKSTLHKYCGKFAKFRCQLYLSRCIHARHHILHSTHSTPMKWWLGPSNWKHHETSPGPATLILHHVTEPQGPADKDTSSSARHSFSSETQHAHNHRASGAVVPPSFWPHNLLLKIVRAERDRAHAW